MTRIALLHSRVRAEEKLLLEAADRLGVDLEPLHDDALVLGLDAPTDPHDAYLVRTMGHFRGLYLLRWLRSHGLTAVNRFETAETCGDKFETSLRLRRAGIPTPETRLAFTAEGALGALDELGYPAVVKPTVGSWARLVARVDHRDQAEAILEHRDALPHPLHHVHYLQEYVDKAREGQHHDLRAFVAGDETLCCIERVSHHWVTNTARGATTRNRPVDDDLHDLCQRTAAAVGGGVLAIDLMETPDGPTVHEVNHNMEFRNSIQPTGIDIPGRILQYVVAEARR